MFVLLQFLLMASWSAVEVPFTPKPKPGPEPGLPFLEVEVGFGRRSKSPNMEKPQGD